MGTQVTKTQVADDSEIIALNLWLNQIGVTSVTAWRWRRKGWINPINIAGRLYVTREDRQQFKQRATAGEFAQIHKTPSNGN